MKPDFTQLIDEANRHSGLAEIPQNQLQSEYLKGLIKPEIRPQASFGFMPTTPGTPEHFRQVQHDLTQLQNMQVSSQYSSDLASESLGEFADRALALFAVLDANRNGKISKRELGSAVSTFDLRGKDAQTLAALYTNIAEPGKINFKAWKLGEADGISRLDLLELQYKLLNDGVIHEDLKEGLSNAIQSVSQSQQVASRRLFSDAKNPVASITPLAIRQGTVKDCYFEASLSSLAAANPAATKNMIQPLKNGDYKVTFPGDPSHPVFVSQPTEAEAGLYNRGTPFGTWAGVMEKAYGEYIRPRTRDGANAVTAQESLNDGSEKSAIKLLTGHDARTYPSQRNLHLLLSQRKVDSKTLANTITDALSEGRLVAAATTSRDATTFNGYSTDHAHAILAFDRTAGDGGTLLIYNPDGAPSTLSFNKFMQTFADVTTESRQSLIGPCNFDKVKVNCAG